MYDTETILLDVKRLLLDSVKGINAQITFINSDKSASDVANYGKVITLDPVNSKALFLLNFDYSIPGFNVLAAIKIEKKDRGDMGDVNLTIGVKIAVLDKSDGTIDVRAVRYLQALENLFDRNRYFGGLRFSRMENMEASIAIDQQSGQSWREVGISLNQYYPEW